MSQQFDQLDLNHDGFLDKAELTAYFAAQPVQQRRDGPPKPAGPGLRLE
jgi:hypothetical protein